MIKFRAVLLFAPSATIRTPGLRVRDIGSGEGAVEINELRNKKRFGVSND